MSVRMPSASSIPFGPVNAFAFPELITNALSIWGSSRIITSIGAALALFCVYARAVLADVSD